MGEEGKLQQTPEKGEKQRKKLLLIILCAILVIAGIVMAVLLLNGKKKLSAVVIRLIERDGAVAMRDEKGSDRELLDNMRLNSGSLLTTGADGLLKLDMDETKIVTMVEDSRLAVEKNGKALALDLQQGSLLFNVTQKLNDDEAFDIRTSTMVVGIRGTSAWVDADTFDLYLLDGKLHITGINPNTGGTRETDITAGQHIRVYLFDDRTGTDSVDFYVEEVQPHDLPERLRRILREDPELDPLRTRILEDTGWVPDDFDDWLFPESDGDGIDQPAGPEAEPEPEAGVTYSLTWIIDGRVMSGGEYPDSYVYGEGLSGFPSPAREGYTFDGWYEDADLTTSAYGIGAKDEGDRTFYGTWLEDGSEVGETYAVLYSVTGLKSFRAGDFNLVTSYVSGEETALVKPEKPGYTFDGWYEDEAMKHATSAISEEQVGNVRLYGRFIPHEYKISYAVDGISSFDAAGYGMPMTYKVGSEIDIPSPSIWGYDFYGWYRDNTMKEAVSYIPADTIGDIGLYGIAVKADDGEDAPDDGDGEDDDGEDDDGEDDDGEDDDGEDEVVVSHIQYVVEGVADFNPSDYACPGTYTEGVGSDLTLPAITGYTFDGWYADVGRTTRMDSISAEQKGDVTVYGFATPDSYVITYNVTGMNDFDAAAYHLPTTYTYGVGATLSGITPEGRTFDGWYADAGRTTSITEIATTRTGDVTVYGSVTNNTYAITYSVTGVNGFDAAAYHLPTEYTYGTAVALTAPAITGHDFAGWYADAGLTTAITEIAATRTGDVTLYGEATAETYAITYDVTGLANFDPAAFNLPTTYTYGTGAALTAPTHDGYDFDCWYADATLSTALTEVSATQTGDLTIYGEAVARTFDITFYQRNCVFNGLAFNTILAGSPTITISGVVLNTTYTYSETDIALPALDVLNAPAVNGLGNYIRGYYDDQGNFMNNVIPAGTTGDIDIYINYYQMMAGTAMSGLTGNYAETREVTGPANNGNTVYRLGATGQQMVPNYYVDATTSHPFYALENNVNVYTLWDNTTFIGIVSENGGVVTTGFSTASNTTNYPNYTGYEMSFSAYVDFVNGELSTPINLYLSIVYDTTNIPEFPEIVLNPAPFRESGGGSY
ncbi:MAG: InlB B-repeat-containing protein [Lachnospiraceae bacterium]|nr:InlB B-repeat-containing protein [Lachnospiraceae bacterium]